MLSCLPDVADASRTSWSPDAGTLAGTVVLPVSGLQFHPSWATPVRKLVVPRRRMACGGADGRPAVKMQQEGRGGL